MKKYDFSKGIYIPPKQYSQREYITIHDSKAGQDYRMPKS